MFNGGGLSLSLHQISAVQDTPELLGFLRNTSVAQQRLRRSVPSPKSPTGKILVSFNRTHVSVVHTDGHTLEVTDVSSSLLSVLLDGQNCTNISCLMITCLVGRLDRGESAVVKIRSRLWAQTFLRVSITLPAHSLVLLSLLCMIGTLTSNTSAGYQATVW